MFYGSLEWFGGPWRQQDPIICKMIWLWNFEQLKTKKNQIFVVIFATLIFASWLHCVATSSNFWLQRTLENFLRESQTFPRYVTSSPNLGLSNGTKIITCGSLEKNRHAYFKKRYPHLPFVSYFSKCNIQKTTELIFGGIYMGIKGTW